MSTRLRTYRITALLTAFALMASAFAPLSSVCGMVIATPKPVQEAPTPPCHAMGGIESDAMPMEHHAPESDSPNEGSASMLACCKAKSLTSLTTEVPAQPTVVVAELMPGIEMVSPVNLNEDVRADESPPLRSTPIHIALGRFLT